MVKSENEKDEEEDQNTYFPNKDQPSDIEKTQKLEKNQRQSPDDIVDDPFDETHEKLIVNSIVIVSLIGFGGLGVGIVWAIKDIFSEDVWTTFKNAAIQFQLFWIGVILLGLFFLVLFLVVLYKRGRRSVAESLFKKKPEEQLKQGDEYIPAKIITAGALLSVFVIFVGFLIAFIQSLIYGLPLEEFSSFWEFLEDMKGGLRIISIATAVLILDGLIYIFVYIWMNGQWVVINKILTFNKEITGKYSFEKGEEITGKVVFAIVVTEIVMIIFGIIWAIIDAIALNWSETFKSYKIGYQISFYGIFSSLLFATLVGAMFMYKRGLNIIMISLFVQLSPREDKSNNMAKVITIGILVGIIFIVLGLGIWVVTLIAEGLSGTSGDNLFQLLAGLSGGLGLLAYGLIAFIFTLLALIFSFFLHNGYAFTMDKILKIERKLDEGLDEIAKPKK